MAEPRIANWLIAHTNKDKSGVAQAKVRTTSEKQARELFKAQYPNREISQVGIEGMV